MWAKHEYELVGTIHVNWSVHEYPQVETKAKCSEVGLPKQLLHQVVLDSFYVPLKGHSTHLL